MSRIDEIEVPDALPPCSGNWRQCRQVPGRHVKLIRKQLLDIAGNRSEIRRQDADACTTYIVKDVLIDILATESQIVTATPYVRVGEVVAHGVGCLVGVLWRGLPVPKGQAG